MTAGTALRIEFAPAVMPREVAAYYIGRSLRELDDLRAQGKITAHGPGKRIYFKKEELDRWISELPERPLKEKERA